MTPHSLITAKNIQTSFGAQIVHKNLSFQIFQGEIFGIVGGSGSGKTVLLRHLVGLTQPNYGKIVYEFEGQELTPMQVPAGKLGVMFQSGALISSLTIEENLIFPLKELHLASFKLAYEKATYLLEKVGLPLDTMHKYPRQISGGMIKRASIARALITNPTILFLDEPTAGLDPIGADQFDELLLKLHHDLDMTVVIITHDLDSLKRLCPRTGILVDKHMLITQTKDVHQIDHPWVKEYFSGPRALRLFPY